MKRKVAVFEDKDFGKIRLFSNEGVLYFSLKDLCKILGIKNAGDIKKRLDDGKDNKFLLIDILDATGKRKQPAIFVKETTMYKIIFQSRKSKAEEVIEWLTAKVKVSFWENPSNLMNDMLENLDFGIEVLEDIKNRRKK